MCFWNYKAIMDRQTNYSTISKIQHHSLSNTRIDELKFKPNSSIKMLGYRRMVKLYAFHTSQVVYADLLCIIICRLGYPSGSRIDQRIERLLDPVSMHRIEADVIGIISTTIEVLSGIQEPRVKGRIIRLDGLLAIDCY